MNPLSYIRLLRQEGDFARLYFAQVASIAGLWIVTVALLGLVLELTGLAGLSALILVIQTGGIAVGAPFGGMLADRIDRRRLLIFANGGRIPIALVLLAVHDRDLVWIVFTCIGLLAVGSSLFEPTATAALPNLVGRERLAEANVLIGMAWGVTSALGAAVGGVVAVVVGRDATFILTACAYGVSLLLTTQIRRRLQVGTQSGEPAGFVESVRDAITFTARSRLLSAFVLSKATFGVGTGVVALFSVFGAEIHQAGDFGVGLLFAARGIGATIGPVIARAVVGTTDRSLLVTIAGSLVTMTIAYSLLPAAPSIWFAGLCVLVAHCGGGAQWAFSTLGLQRHTPDHLRGRVVSFDYGLVTLMITLSTLTSGALADTLSPAYATWIMAGLIAIVGLGWITFARSAWTDTTKT